MDQKTNNIVEIDIQKTTLKDILDISLKNQSQSSVQQNKTQKKLSKKQQADNANQIDDTITLPEKQIFQQMEQIEPYAINNIRICSSLNILSYWLSKDTQNIPQQQQQEQQEQQKQPSIAQEQQKLRENIKSQSIFTFINNHQKILFDILSYNEQNTENIFNLLPSLLQYYGNKTINVSFGICYDSKEKAHTVAQYDKKTDTLLLYIDEFSRSMLQSSDNSIQRAAIAHELIHKIDARDANYDNSIETIYSNITKEAKNITNTKVILKQALEDFNIVCQYTMATSYYEACIGNIDKITLQENKNNFKVLLQEYFNKFMREIVPNIVSFSHGKSVEEINESLIHNQNDPYFQKSPSIFSGIQGDMQNFLTKTQKEDKDIEILENIEKFPEQLMNTKNNIEILHKFILNYIPTLQSKLNNNFAQNQQQNQDEKKQNPPDLKDITELIIQQNNQYIIIQKNKVTTDIVALFSNKIILRNLDYCSDNIKRKFLQTKKPYFEELIDQKIKKIKTNTNIQSDLMSTKQDQKQDNQGDQEKDQQQQQNIKNSQDQNQQNPNQKQQDQQQIPQQQQKSNQEEEQNQNQELEDQEEKKNNHLKRVEKEVLSRTYGDGAYKGQKTQDISEEKQQSNKNKFNLQQLLIEGNGGEIEKNGKNEQITEIRNIIAASKQTAVEDFKAVTGVDPSVDQGEQKQVNITTKQKQANAIKPKQTNTIEQKQTWVSKIAEQQNTKQKPTITFMPENDHLGNRGRKTNSSNVSANDANGEKIGDHEKNINYLIENIKNGKTPQNTVIVLERKQIGDNLGMQDMIMLAEMIKYNEKHNENAIKTGDTNTQIIIPEEVKISAIYKEAELYNIAKEHNIQIIGMEGKDLQHQNPQNKSASSKSYRQEREAHMIKTIENIAKNTTNNDTNNISNTNNANIVVLVGSAHVKNLQNSLSTARE